MDLDSLLVWSGRVVLYEFYSHLMTLLQIDCHNLFNLRV